MFGTLWHLPDNAFGGGVYAGAGSTLTARRTQIKHNRAEGGPGGPTGAAGQGVGGGAYNLGTFFLDDDSAVENNDASTSDDDVFGELIDF